MLDEVLDVLDAVAGLERVPTLEPLASAGDPAVARRRGPGVEYQLFEKGSRKRLHPRMTRDALF